MLPLARRILLVPLLLCALQGLVAGPALSDRVALVIGNGAYQSSNVLPNPPRDAAAIAAKLEELDFAVTRATDADLEGMRAALRSFGAKARGAEAAVIFYAGHGLQVDGENYLLPVDARIGARADLAADGLPASEIYGILLAAEPELAVLILDACRDNPFVSAVSTSAGLASGSISAGAFVQRPGSAGMVIGFAAAPGAVAYDGGNGTSPYTTALLQWIDRPGLEIGAMFRHVRGTVLELTRGQQVPWVEEALLRNVYLRAADAPAVEPDPEAASVEMALLETIRALNVPAEQQAAMEFYSRLTGSGTASSPPSSPRGDAFVRAGLIWLSIRSTEDISLLEDYVETFPGSQFASLALERIASLETGRPAADEAPRDGTGPGDTGSIASTAAATKTGGSSDAPPSAQPPVLDLRQPNEVTIAGAAGAGDLSVPSTGPSGVEAVSASTAPNPGASLDLHEQAASSVLSASPPADTESALGLDAAELAAVQGMLAEAGHYDGTIDAIFGPGTRRAVEAFQQSAGLASNGYLNGETLRALVRDTAGALLRSDRDSARRDAVHGVASVAERGPGAVPTVLRVATLSRNDEVHAYWNQIASRFEADHPGTIVRFEHQPDWEYKENLLGMLGSDTPPDIMHTWGGGHLLALRDAGFVRDLSAEMAGGWALEFRPGALQNFTQDGRIYGVPSSVALVSLWVNAPLLERAGIQLGQLATWDGFLAAVRTLKVKGVVPLAVGGRDAWPFQLIWGNLALEQGARAGFEAALAGDGEGFRAPTYVEAGNKLNSLAKLSPFQEGYLEMDEAAAGNAFAEGRTAMVVTGNWRLHSMGWHWPGGPERMREQIRRLDFPGLAATAGGSMTYGGADGYAVNQRAPDVAVDLLRLLTSREVQSRIAELTQTVPSVSGSDLALADPLVADVAESLLTSSYHQLYYDQALGPVVGAVVNDVAMGLATGSLTGAEAAGLIDAAWDKARPDVFTAPPPSPSHPAASPPP